MLPIAFEIGKDRMHLAAKFIGAHHRRKQLSLFRFGQFQRDPAANRRDQERHEKPAEHRSRETNQPWRARIRSYRNTDPGDRRESKKGNENHAPDLGAGFWYRLEILCSRRRHRPDI